MARAMGDFLNLTSTTQDTTGPSPVVHVTMRVGHPPIDDEEWIGDLNHRIDSDQIYYQLYGRFPE